MKLHCRLFGHKPVTLGIVDDLTGENQPITTFCGRCDEDLEVTPTNDPDVEFQEIGSGIK